MPKTKSKLPPETSQALKTLGLTLPSFKGCTQVEADAKMAEWRGKGGKLLIAVKAHRKKWHPDKRKTAKGKTNAEVRFKRGETAAKHLMGLKVKVRAPRPRQARSRAPGDPFDNFVNRHWSEPGARTPPPPMPKRRPKRGGVAQATGIPPNVAMTPDGVPLGVPRNGIPHHVRQRQQPQPSMNPRAQMGSVFVEVQFGPGVGMSGMSASVDLDAVLNSIFDSVQSPQPTSRGRRGFRLPPWA